jgi:hypothetical protein
MKLTRPPRFTVRRPLVAVAIVALVVGAKLGLDRRSRDFRRLAAYDRSRMAVVAREGPAGTARVLVDSRGEAVTPERDRWHGRMEEKYRSAAARPWLPALPEMPEMGW